MTVDDLVPCPAAWEPFRRDRYRYVPDGGGCYALTTFERSVLYIGLATNLRRRMVQHLDGGRVTVPTARGRAILFHWAECKDLEKVERTWLNIHLAREGVLPAFNRIYSPTLC